MSTTTLRRTTPGKVQIGVAQQIHAAIHSQVQSVILPDEYGVEKEYRISTGTNLCRQLTYNGILFMEQNKSKQSKYAGLAREGHTITWGIRQPKWLYILDGKITDH